MPDLRSIDIVALANGGTTFASLWIESLCWENCNAIH
jgi:hypothetical protein